MEQVTYHEHTGLDSPQIQLKNLVGFPLQALTTANNDPLSSGGSSDLKSSDAAIIDNMRTRINELESRLQALEALL